ncbi:hypothetical protein [Haloactinomyces albus]|uniref:Condensation domain-containing protein n=1 Tax=Haloactinomyces albus TaxID=1352928 RepID=A0AAE3ZA99_9ACTN|nr:hypothetical protein [Haloactinomyces albus]MDR7301221.1 hypothetical protein [Haloactinomyces albus]
MYELQHGVTEAEVADALRTLLQRFEGLRSTVVREGPSTRQRVHAEGTVRLAVHEAGAGDAAVDAAAAVVEELAEEPFDVAAEWPLRAAVVTEGLAPRFLALVFSHLAVDAFALLPVTDHLVATVAVRHPDWPESRTGEPGRQPYEQAAAEAGEGGQRMAERALRRIADVFRRMPAAPPPRGATPEGDRFRSLSHRSPALDLAVGAVSLRCGESVAAVLTAAMIAVDSAFEGSSTGYAQLITANRSRPELVNAVVPCSQPVPCCVDIGREPFTELVHRTASAALGAHRFGSYPPTGLVEIHRAVEEERGVRLDISPTLNYRPRATSLPRREVTEEELSGMASLRRTSWTFDDPLWQASRYLSADVSEAGIHLLLQVDTAMRSPGWAEQWMEALESLLCAAAVREVGVDELVSFGRQSEARNQESPCH